MSDSGTSELQRRLDAATEALRRSEERSTAGLLALEMLHDIRGPLEALGNLTFLAAQDANGNQKVREYMHLAEEQLQHLRAIAGDTLSVARSSSAPTLMDVVALIEAALRIHQRAARDKNIRVVKRLPEQLLAPVFRGEMVQALSNLIANAVEALQPEGTLYLHAHRCNDQIYLTVADTGRGIDPVSLGTIFEPFFTTKGEQGNGFGLALTKKVIDHHRGSIRVRSSIRPTRSGTAFRISLPASGAPAC